ncbi:hypothetical protein ACIO14_31325 [Nocardia fluminea]|uniref:hypothetical protein n=1 Tax=Nocardia fluminea TaxID=134984 RepID=UPI00381AF691
MLHTLTSDTELSDQRATVLALTQALAVVFTIRRPLLGCAASLAAVVTASAAVDISVWVDPMLRHTGIPLGDLLAGLVVVARALDLDARCQSRLATSMPAVGISAGNRCERSDEGVEMGSCPQGHVSAGG